jgi:exodeoxyribonuclease VII large subunit
MNRGKIYSVSSVNQYIKNMFSNEYALAVVFVKGEISNCKYHSSGHIYFTIKDAFSQLACVMFRGDRNGLDFKMENGMEVVAAGSINVYERDGKYQLYAKKIVQAGDGALAEKYEQLKKKLEAAGYFDEDRKLPIPKYVKRIGIVTAKTGAALQDMIHIAARRNPYVQLILYPARVQGQGAAETIVKGIERLDKESVDVIIVGRGGGSLEDLWAFNEEIVADAIFACRTPVISAVGHETDTTISDYVADLRAPTPSAAVELAVYDVRQVLEELYDYKDRLARGVLSVTEGMR